MRNKLSKNSGRNTLLGRQKTQCPCALTKVAAARKKAKKIGGLVVGDKWTAIQANTLTVYLIHCLNQLTDEFPN